MKTWFNNSTEIDVSINSGQYVLYKVHDHSSYLGFSLEHDLEQVVPIIITNFLKLAQDIITSMCNFTFTIRISCVYFQQPNVAYKTLISTPVHGPNILN
jgi:hypothetical protein